MIVPPGIAGYGHQAMAIHPALAIAHIGQTWVHAHRTLFFFYRDAIAAGIALIFGLCSVQLWRARRWIHYDFPALVQRVEARVAFTGFKLMSHPILNARKSTVFAAPGFLDFQGGVFNPGAIVHDGKIIVCAKSQEMHWEDAIRSQRFDFYMKGKPVLIEMDRDLRIQNSVAIQQINNLPEDEDIGIEDFRLFQFDGETYINHSMCHKEPRGGYQRAEQCLSRLDLDRREITYLGKPQVDFEVSPMEKNWTYFERDGELYMLFSLSPYVVLKAANWPGLSFETVLRAEVDTRPFHSGVFPNFLSWGANPIDYDSNHLLSLVHRFLVIEHRTYAHWAVLIDKQSLLPVKVSSRPILCGGKAHGNLPGIVYTSAVVKDGNSLILFSGESDLVCAYSKIDRKQLDDCWTDLKVRVTEPDKVCA